MIKTSTGSPDGITIETYEANKIYELPEKLAVNFVRDQKMAVLAPLEKQIPPENQAVKPPLNMDVPERAITEKTPEPPLRADLKEKPKEETKKRKYSFKKRNKKR